MVIWGPFRLQGSHTKEVLELWDEVFRWHIVVVLSRSQFWWVDIIWVLHFMVYVRAITIPRIIIIISGMNNPMKSKVYVPFCCASWQMGEYGAFHRRWLHVPVSDNLTQIISFLGLLLEEFFLPVGALHRGPFIPIRSMCYTRCGDQSDLLYPASHVCVFALLFRFAPYSSDAGNAVLLPKIHLVGFCVGTFRACDTPWSPLFSIPGKVFDSCLLGKLSFTF